MGDRRDVEALQSALMEDGFATLSLDLPGHGDTARLNDVRAAVDAVTIEIKAQIDVHPGRPIVLIGYSMGGRLALQLAASNHNANKSAQVEFF